MYYEKMKETVPEVPVTTQEIIAKVDAAMEPEKDLFGHVVVPRKPWQLDLLNAADYIRSHGWCQNEATDYWGNVCLAEAINKTDMRNRVEAVTKVTLAVGCNGIPHWNDKPGRTKEEVLNLLETLAGSE